MRGEKRNGAPDGLIAALAARQHGVVASRQLREAGVSRGAIERRLARGLLIPLFPRVYAVGHAALRREGRWLAAVLATGPSAVLSYRSAAALWGIFDPPARAIDVSVGRRLRSVGGIDRHWAHLPLDEVTTRASVPVTTVPRTIFDLAAVMERRRLERVIREAEVGRLDDALSLADLLARYPRKRGAARVRAILAMRDLGLDVTREELEHRFLSFLDERGLPRPLLNRRLRLGNRWIVPDCMWPQQKVIVELDSRAVHDRSDAFESDRVRDRRLQAAGWRVTRVTWRALHLDPDDVEADLRTLLGLL